MNPNLSLGLILLAVLAGVVALRTGFLWYARRTFWVRYQDPVTQEWCMESLSDRQKRTGRRPA